jgi:hypothetical protein
MMTKTGLKRAEVFAVDRRRDLRSAREARLRGELATRRLSIYSIHHMDTKPYREHDP